MRALIGAEIRRLAARRVVKGLGLLVLVVSAFAGVLVFVNHESASVAELEARRSEARQRVEQCLQGNVEDIAPPGAIGPGGRVPPPFCEDIAGSVDDPRFVYSDLPGILKGTTAPLVILAMVIGAAAMGADWQNRSLTTLLTWEPRRQRVLVAKALAVVAVVLAFTWLAQAVMSLALLPSGLWRGTMAGVDAEWARAMGGTLSRGALATGVFAVLGFAGASAAKSTTAVLGIAFGYVTVIENVVSGLLVEWRQWLLLGNTIVFVSGNDAGGDLLNRSVVGAGVYLTALGLGAMVAALVAFQERDIG